jgi:hypothetical protein
MPPRPVFARISALKSPEARRAVTAVIIFVRADCPLTRHSPLGPSYGKTERELPSCRTNSYSIPPRWTSTEGTKASRTSGKQRSNR